MKNTKLLALAIVLSSISSVIYADRVENPFDSDETLTATRMNEIRSAINDNDARIANKQENIGQGCSSSEAIQDIESDGTVRCIELPQGGAGNGVTTEYYYISGADLKPLESTAEIDGRNIQDAINLEALGDPLSSRPQPFYQPLIKWSSYDVDGLYGFPVRDGDHKLGHGVRLPNGAEITDIRCYYYDNDPNYNITRFDFNFYKREYLQKFADGNSLEQLLTDPNDDVSTTGASSSIRELIARNRGSSSSSTFNHIVDNSRNAYTLRVRLHASDGYSSFASNDEAGNNRHDSAALRTYGCRITYEH